MEALVIVDVQNDFIDGALRNEEAIKRIPNIIEEINNFKGKYIFLTRDTHDKNYMNTMFIMNIIMVQLRMCLTKK